MYVAFDLETHPITAWNKAPKPVCMSYQFEDMDGPAICLADDGASMFEGVAPDTILVGHHVSFDLAVLFTHYPELKDPIFRMVVEGRVLDTEIREKLISIRQGTRSKDKFSLAAVTEKYTGYRPAKGEETWRKRYAELEDVPLRDWPEDAIQYSLDDASNTLAVFQAQRRLFAKCPLPPGEEVRQVQAAFALHVTSLTGLRTDKARVDEFERRNTALLKQHQETLITNGIYHRNKKTGELKTTDKGTYARNMAEVKRRVAEDFQARGRPVPVTDKGNVKTAEEVLEECDDPVLKALAAISECSKMLSTYLPILKDRLEHPISCSYDSLVSSGRTSSFKPNDQNPPRAGGYRECHVAPEGWSFISVDYDQAELQAVAQIHYWAFGKSSMMDAINSGKDLHCMVAANALNIPYEEAYAQRKVKGSLPYRWRQMAKEVNFGRLGGMGAETLVRRAKLKGLTISLQDATRLIAIQTQTFPELVLYFEQASEKTGWAGDKKLTHWVSKREASGLDYCQYLNLQFQGGVSDVAKQAHWRIVYACEVDRASPLYGCKAVLFLHDETLALAPDSKLTEAAEEVARIMRTTMKEWFPNVKGGASPAAGKFWTKDWEEVRDANGKLVCWEPEPEKKAA